MAARKRPAPPVEPYDYEGEARGQWAPLVSGKFRVTLTEYPRTLLSMYAAGVLTGTALADAQALAATAEGRAYLGWRDRVTGPLPISVPGGEVYV